MELKYRQLIADQNLTIKCPPENCKLNSAVEGVRWVIEPIGNELNFLPNHLFNQKKGVPSRSLSEDIKCGYCSISLHESVEASTNAFRGLSSSIKNKLGYTHMAKGLIEASIGLMTDINPISKHFELFEKDGYNWSHKFKIISQL